MPDASTTASSRVAGFSFQLPEMKGFRANKAVAVSIGAVCCGAKAAAVEAVVRRKARVLNFIVVVV